MKKLLTIFVLFITFCLSSINMSFAGAPWENPRSIRTYIQPHSYKPLMKQAFAEWTRVTNGKIVFKYVENPKDAQISVAFIKDASTNSQLSRAIGVTYPHVSGGYMRAAEMEIASHVPGSAGRLMPKDRIYRVMIHEIGHAIGLLEHSADTASIMYPTAISRNQAITKGDLNTLAKLYGWK